MNVRPLDDRCTIRPTKVEEQTPGGIFLPSQAIDIKSMQGTVVAVGPGRRRDNGSFGEMSVSVGDEVFYDKYAAKPVDDNSGLLLVRERDILAILEK